MKTVSQDWNAKVEVHVSRSSRGSCWRREGRLGSMSMVWYGGIDGESDARISKCGYEGRECVRMKVQDTSSLMRGGVQIIPPSPSPTDRHIIESLSAAVFKYYSVSISYLRFRFSICETGPGRATYRFADQTSSEPKKSCGSRPFLEQIFGCTSYHYVMLDYHKP